MRTLMELDPKMRNLSEEIRSKGATRTAEYLMEVSQLLNSQRFDPLLLDLIPRLLNPNSLRQEIEITRKNELENWYNMRNRLFRYLLYLILIIVLFVSLEYFLSYNTTIFFPIGFIAGLALLITLGCVFLPMWFYYSRQIQKSKRQTEQVCSELSLGMQDITREFLLIAAKSTELPREPATALSVAANQIQQALQQLVKTNQEALDGLATTNREAVDALQRISDEVKRRLEVFDEQLTPGMVSLQNDLQAFSATVRDYQQQLTSSNVELVSILHDLATSNSDHLNIEQSLHAQIKALNDAQQIAADQNTATAANISTVALSIVNIADHLTHRLRRISTETVLEGQEPVGTDEPRWQYDFDVYLCYDNRDKLAVEAIGKLLKARGIAPWLDTWEVPPGISWQSALQDQLPHIKSVAVFIGKEGMGPWQQKELRAILWDFVEQDHPVIPVLLPEFDKADLELPAFLRSTSWVDFRQKDPDPLQTLIWGIIGQRVAS